MNREQAIEKYLIEEEKIVPPKIVILHVSPDVAIYNILKHISSIDYTPTQWKEEDRAIQFLPNNEHFELMDIMDIKKPDNTYDLIICSHVLEHVKDDQLAMSELYRVLKQGGRAILCVPFSKTAEEYEEAAEVSEHYRAYTPMIYEERLKLAGFELERYGEEDINKYEGGFLTIATKPYAKL